MQKICYLLPQYYLNSAENFYHIINFLSELGKKVELYVIIEHSDESPNIDNVKEIFVINGPKKKTYFRRFYEIINIYFKLYKIGVRVFFSRASSTGVFPLVVANKLLNFNQADVLFWSCGQDVVPLSFNPSKKNLKRIITRLLSKFIFKQINYLTTGPESMVEYYHKHYNIPKEKIILLYNDISLDRFYPLSHEEKTIRKNELIGSNKQIMLFVHTFNYARGTDLLYKIALKLKKIQANVLIVAIGRQGDYSLELENQIKEYQLDDYLLNLGTVANKDIVKYYQISDMFIMPSRGEGFPRVLIEAMACKCVPVSFDVGGVKDILHKDLVPETMINVLEEDLFVDRSIELILKENSLKKYANLCYEKVKEYETTKIVQMYCDQFKLVGKK